MSGVPIPSKEGTNATPCSYCGADVGAPCTMTIFGRQGPPMLGYHRARYDAASAKLAQARQDATDIVGYPPPEHKEPATQYLIWSYRHHQWWGPDHCGYTPSVSQAGLYTKEAAAAVMFNALPGQNLAIDKISVQVIMEGDGDVEKTVERWRQL